MSNFLPAIIVFGILLAICLAGLAISTRASERLDASRSGSRPSHPQAPSQEPGTGRMGL